MAECKSEKLHLNLVKSCLRLDQERPRKGMMFGLGAHSVSPLAADIVTAKVVYGMFTLESIKTHIGLKPMRLKV